MSFTISSVICLRSFPCLALIPSSVSWFFSWQLFLLGLALFLLPYVFVAVSILKIASFKGCIKAFKTCGFHLATVTLFYGTVLSVYMHHSSQHSTKQDNVLSVVYAILIPMLNPLIYSLRNTEIKGVLKRMKKKVAHLPQKE